MVFSIQVPFFRSLRAGPPSICELIKSLCEGGGRLFTGLRGRGVRKVLEILAIFGSEDNIPIRRFFASLICFYPSVKLEAMKIGLHNLWGKTRELPDSLFKWNNGFCSQKPSKSNWTFLSVSMEKRVHWEVHDEIEGNSRQISTTVNGKMSPVIQILMHPSFTHKGG